MRNFCLAISASALAFDNESFSPAAAVAAARSASQRRGVRGSSDPMLARDTALAKMVPYWDKVDSVVDGIEAMRLAGDDYLPRFADEDADEYAYRLLLTKMTNVYRDIVESLSAKPFERDAKLEGEVPSDLKSFENDVDGAGNSLSVFANHVFFNGINSAIDWIYVDYPAADPTVITMADAKASGRRPYWSRVLGCNIIKATSEMIGGVETLTFIRIFEPGKPDAIREFQRMPDGMITWAYYERRAEPADATGTHFARTGGGALSISKIPMVPFITGRREGRTWRILPALQDAVELQIELYQQESGLKFAKTLTAYPMLSANGIKPTKNTDGSVMKIRIGPNRILYAPPDGGGNSGSWTYVEPSAESLKFLASDIESTIKELRELGRQPLTVQSSNLTTVTTQVAAGKAKSAIKQWALHLKNALENAMSLTMEYLGDGTAYKPVIYIFTEFDEFYDDKSLDSLGKDRDRGDLSRETYWSEMKRRGIYSSEFDPAQEEARLLAELPGAGPDMTGQP